MWADRISPERLRELVERLHSVLPAPVCVGVQHAGFRGQASFEQVAGRLCRQPGFAYLNGSGGARLLHSPLLTFSYADGACAVSGPSGHVTLQAPAFDILQAIHAAYLGSDGPLLAGFLSYDLAGELEELGRQPQADFAFPQFHFALYDAVFTQDAGGWSLTNTNAWRAPFSIDDAESLLASRAPGLSAATQAASKIVSRPDRAAFETSVKHVVERIHQGDIFQTNLCRCLTADWPAGSEWNLFQRMRALNPAQYEAFVNVGDGRALLSISPEMFLRVKAGVVESSPIKGTRPRGASLPDDEASARALSSSEKDRAELAMIVDVTRNDLGRVCGTGSVRVTEHATLMSLPTVHHLFSTVQGRLRGDVSLVDLLRAAFPAASITGAPKIEAMRMALREEGRRRGPCMGAIGWMDGQNMEMSVAIRTAFASGGRVRYYAGGGITADSIPGDEFVETAHKAAAFVRAIGDEGENL